MEEYPYGQSCFDFFYFTLLFPICNLPTRIPVYCPKICQILADVGMANTPVQCIFGMVGIRLVWYHCGYFCWTAFTKMIIIWIPMAQPNSPDMLPNLNIFECFCFPGNPWHQTNHQEVCWCKIWVSGKFTNWNDKLPVFIFWILEKSISFSLQRNIFDW